MRTAEEYYGLAICHSPFGAEDVRVESGLIYYGRGNLIGELPLEEPPFLNPYGPLGERNWNFFRDWVFGMGSNNRFYGPDTVETQEMQNSPGANALRGAFYEGGCKDIKDSPDFRYETRQAAWDTLINPFTADWSNTAAQVGGFSRPSAINNGDGTVTFTPIKNVAGTRSFFYHRVRDRRGTRGPMRNITQTFQWTEPIGRRKY